jgi:hypothetical protein
MPGDASHEVCALVVNDPTQQPASRHVDFSWDNTRE